MYSSGDANNGNVDSFGGGASGAESRGTVRPRDTLRILHADDAKIYRRTMHRILTVFMGIDSELLHQVEDGFEALEAVFGKLTHDQGEPKLSLNTLDEVIRANLSRLSSSYDLIILDNSMPNMSGTMAARFLKQHLPGIPVIFCTLDVHTDEMKRLADGFLKKPLVRTDVERVLNEVFGAGEALDAGHCFRLYKRQRSQNESKSEATAEPAEQVSHTLTSNSSST